MSRFFQTRRESRTARIIYSWPVIVLIFLAIGYVGQYTLRAYQNYRAVEREYAVLTDKENEISSRIMDIQSNVALLESEAGRERVIRERFDVQKEDEEVVIFIKDENKTEPPPPSTFQSVTSFLKNLFGL